MKIFSVPIFVISMLLALSSDLMAAQDQTLPPEIPFESVPDFFKYPFEMNLGEMASVAVNSKGHVFMLSRSNVTGPLYGAIATQVLEFDRTGKYLREWGKNLYGFGYAHSIRFDRNDNLWVVDKGTNMIIKFNQEGHATMVLGRKEEATDEHNYISLQGTDRPAQVDNYFNQPTDIAWDKDDNIYISDGYVNSRIAKIDKNGDWVKSWGVRGSAPGQFNTPHNIGIDRDGNIYVADRQNARIEVYDTEGVRKKTIKINVPAPQGAKMVLGNTPPTPPEAGTMSPGATWTVCITPGPTQFLYTNDAFPGRFYKIKLPEGNVVGMFGMSGRQLGQFNWNHGIACPSENELYVADLNNWRVQKLILHPERMKPRR